MELVVFPAGWARWRGAEFPCAIGRGGAIVDKREGDRATPIGIWPLRRVLFRPDRLAQPVTALPVAALQPDDGWCDDPGDPSYNRPVRLPYPARCESLWRTDEVYDLICVLGHNDGPPIPGRGSAIFLHVARQDLAPTEGCVALKRADLLAVLWDAAPGDSVRVLAP